MTKISRIAHKRSPIRNDSRSLSKATSTQPAPCSPPSSAAMVASSRWEARAASAAAFGRTVSPVCRELRMSPWHRSNCRVFVPQFMISGRQDAKLRTLNLAEFAARASKCRCAWPWQVSGVEIDAGRPTQSGLLECHLLAGETSTSSRIAISF